MNKIFKGVKVGDKVFNYYLQKWGKVDDCWTNVFIVSYILDTGEEVWYRYTYEGSRWLSGNTIHEVFTEAIPALPADDLSNLREGDKVFVQPYQKWGEVVEVRPEYADIVVKIPRDQEGEEEKEYGYLTVTSTGLLSKNHKAPSVFLEAVPQPTEILTTSQTYEKMNKIFKGIKIGDKVFNYYLQEWGEVDDCWTDVFIVSYILDTGEVARCLYTYDGSGWLSDHTTQEVFTEEIPALPADDLSNLQEGDKVFVQPYQKWAEVVVVRPAYADIVVKIPLHKEGEEYKYVEVTNTGLYSETHTAPIAFLEEVPLPSEILTACQTSEKMNNSFKGIKVGDKVFSYYYQIWGKVITRGVTRFLVHYTLDTGAQVKHVYNEGTGCLSGHRTQEVLTEEIPALPADDLSNLQEGDKVFMQPHQKWAEVTKVLPADVGIIVKVPRGRLKDESVIVTSTGLLNVNHKAPSVFLEEVPQPSEIQRLFASYKKSHGVTSKYKRVNNEQNF